LKSRWGFDIWSVESACGSMQRAFGRRAVEGPGFFLPEGRVSRVIRLGVWSRANDRWFRGSGTGGKSGLHRAGCWVTPSLGDEEDSATESKPPRLVRGKGETVR